MESLCALSGVSVRRMLLAQLLVLMALVSTGAKGMEVQSLEGQWDFRLDENKLGEKEAWWDQTLTDTIRLPGTTDEAGYGEKTQGPVRVRRGGYLSRVYQYIGPAWYQQQIEIPQDWQGKSVDLFLERVLWESKVWLDGRFCGSQDSLGTPHRHPLGKLPPGKHRLTIRIDNSMIHPIGTNGHAYTENTQTIWNGAVGRIELQAKPAVAIDSVQVFSDASQSRIEVATKYHSDQPTVSHATLRFTVRERASARIVANKSCNVDLTQPGHATYSRKTEVKLAQAPATWDEFAPNLYTLDVSITAGDTSDQREIIFGFREIKADGKRFLVNGRPTFIRGSMDVCRFPLTGYPACDVQAWRDIFHTYKQYGMNQIRCHAWCPPEAAFQAADELGIYLQPEVLWIDGWMGLKGAGHNHGTLDQYVRAEISRIIDTYGNHPSFAFFSIGNELGNSNFDVMGRWMHEEKERDPRRLYSASSARAITPSDDYSDTHNIPKVGGVVNRQVGDKGTPHTDWDYQSSYGRAPVPIIAHEMGQVPVYPCWDEIAKYTGVLRARNLEELREQARKNGIEAQSRQLQLASGAMNRIILKNEMEAQLRSPDCSGVNWLSIIDYMGEGEALIGWLDSFYDSKGIVTPAQFRRYNCSTVPLARFKKFVWTADETFQATAQIAHWGPKPLENATVAWRLRNDKNTVVAAGEFPIDHIAVGTVATLGPVEVDLKPIDKATTLNLEIVLAGTEFANDWNLWVFPSKSMTPPPVDVIVTDQTEKAIAALAQGKRVVLLAHQLGARTNDIYAAWMPLFWSYSWFSRQGQTLGALVQNQHPALTGFPTAAHLDWQWRDLCDGARGFVLDDMPADYRPIIQPISDFHINHKLGTIFEFCTKENGKLLACGYNIADNLDQRPAARQLRQSLLTYAASPAFAPSQQITAQRLTELMPSPPPKPFEGHAQPLLFQDDFDAVGTSAWKDYGSQSSRQNGRLVGSKGMVTILEKVQQTDLMASVDARSNAEAGIILRFHSPDHYLVALYSPSLKTIFFHDRKNGQWGPQLGRVAVPKIGPNIHLTAAACQDRAALILTDGKETYHTPVIKVANTSAGKTGLWLYQIGELQQFDNFQLSATRFDP